MHISSAVSVESLAESQVRDFARWISTEPKNQGPCDRAGMVR